MKVGELFYPTGERRFIGSYEEAENGEPYILRAGVMFYKDGTVIYRGRFRISKHGSLGYPRVEYPEGFGSLK